MKNKRIKFCKNGDIEFVGFKPRIEFIKPNKKGEYIVKYETVDIREK